jgi:hypothetical protein
MTVIQINGVDLAAGELSIPFGGAWRLQARCDDDPNLQEGAPFTMTVDGVFFMRGELQRVTRFGDPQNARVRLLAAPTGTKTLSAKMPGTAFANTTRQQALLQMFPDLLLTDPNEAIFNNIVFPAALTGRQMINLFYPGHYWDAQSQLQITPRVPMYNAGDFLQTDSGFSDTITIAVQNDFALWPGDVWFGYSIGSVLYQLGQRPRIVAKVTL